MDVVVLRARKLKWVSEMRESNDKCRFKRDILKNHKASFSSNSKKQRQGICKIVKIPQTYIDRSVENTQNCKHDQGLID
jgi:hypothetical protein